VYGLNLTYKVLNDITTELHTVFKYLMGYEDSLIIVIVIIIYMNIQVNLFTKLLFISQYTIQCDMACTRRWRLHSVILLLNIEPTNMRQFLVKHIVYLCK